MAAERDRQQKKPVHFIPVASLCTQPILAERPQQLITCRQITDTCHDLWCSLWWCTTLGGQVGATKLEPNYVVLQHKRQMSWRKKILLIRKLSFQWMYILGTAVALQVNTQTHAQMLAYIGLFLRVFVAFAHRLFSPSVLFTASREKKKTKKQPLLHCFYVEQNFTVSIMPAWEILSGWHNLCRFQKHTLTLALTSSVI